MDFNQFLTKNQIRLPRQILDLCYLGLEKMDQAVDIKHDINHINRILKRLNQLKESEPDYPQDINYPVLLLAIVWHDIWMSQRTSKYVFTIVRDRYYEGFGSMWIFTKEAKKTNLSPQILHPVRHAIRTHPGPQKLPQKSIEAITLKDLDILDEWSLSRLESLENYYIKAGNINPVLVRLSKTYFNKILSRQTDKRLYYRWSRTQFNKRKPIFIKKVNQLMEKYNF